MDLEPSCGGRTSSPSRTRASAEAARTSAPSLLYRPNASRRPYRTFLATPILFASTALFLITLSCFSKPWESLAAFGESPRESNEARVANVHRQGFCIAGAVPYHFQMKRSRTEEERDVGLEMT